MFKLPMPPALVSARCRRAGLETSVNLREEEVASITIIRATLLISGVLLSFFFRRSSHADLLVS